jgi:hypothetical protein
MSRRTSVWLNDEMDEAVRASGLSVPELIRRGLESIRLAGQDHECAGDELARLLRDQGYRILPPE